MRRTHTRHFIGWWTAAAIAMALITGSLAAEAAGKPQRPVKTAPFVESEPDPHPVWPDNGIAQRKLPGAYMMFVEYDDRGQWHAWATVAGRSVPNDGMGAVTALDFFSGKTFRGKANFERGKQSPGFYEPRTGVHSYEPRAKGFDYYLNVSGLPNGMDLDLDKPIDALSLAGNDCDVRLRGIKGGLEERRREGANPKWIKVPIYRVGPGQAMCTHGEISSTVGTTLDLKDGTFLATMTCWVFRLRKSDLSPVGAAPALRVVDKAAVEAAIKEAKGQNLHDASDYLSKALGLSFDAENSCAENF
ncbi:MAG: hypothetical protein EOP20_12695 [Hyphomicrobiales bacterium]|nr:MAG: hypothetical protein EOP20_12695 [Hyphomicrobiales bacterium]